MGEKIFNNTKRNMYIYRNNNDNEIKKKKM